MRIKIKEEVVTGLVYDDGSPAGGFPNGTAIGLNPGETFGVLGLQLCSRHNDIVMYALIAFEAHVSLGIQVMMVPDSQFEIVDGTIIGEWKILAISSAGILLGHEIVRDLELLQSKLSSRDEEVIGEINRLCNLIN